MRGYWTKQSILQDLPTFENRNKSLPCYLLYILLTKFSTKGKTFKGPSSILTKEAKGAELTGCQSTHGQAKCYGQRGLDVFPQINLWRKTFV